MIQPGYGWERPEDPGKIVMPIPDPIVRPAPQSPPGVSPLAVPPVEALRVLETMTWWEAPSGEVWTQTEAAGQRVIMRIDRDRRVTGIATSIRLRTSGKTTGRYTWRAFYPTGELMAKGTLQDGLPAGRWTFYLPDGTRQLSASYHRGAWR